VRGGIIWILDLGFWIAERGCLKSTGRDGVGGRAIVFGSPAMFDDEEGAAGQECAEGRCEAEADDADNEPALQERFSTAKPGRETLVGGKKDRIEDRQ